MRRRTIVKERTDGIFKDQQGRAGLGRSQRAWEPGEREAVLQQGVAARQPRAGDAHERKRKPPVEPVITGAREEPKLPLDGEEPRAARVQLKGVCQHCGKHIGKGIAFHERYCTSKNEDS